MGASVEATQSARVHQSPNSIAHHSQPTAQPIRGESTRVVLTDPMKPPMPDAMERCACGMVSGTSATIGTLYQSCATCRMP
jgi:hypothetical protein